MVVEWCHFPRTLMQFAPASLQISDFLNKNYDEGKNNPPKKSIELSSSVEKCSTKYKQMSSKVVLWNSVITKSYTSLDVWNCYIFYLKRR